MKGIQDSDKVREAVSCHEQCSPKMYGEVDKAWPPPAQCFGSGQVGLTYFIQKWFRDHLKWHIEHSIDYVIFHVHIDTEESRDGPNPVELAAALHLRVRLGATDGNWAI